MSLNSNALFNVKGKVCVVTGGGRGIGRMIAEGLVENGCTVLIVSRDESALRKTAEELTKKGPGRAVAVVSDLQDSMAGSQKVVHAVQKEGGKLHVLVNNSGTSWGAPLETYPDSAWEKVLGLNLKAIFVLTQQCLPLLKNAASPEDPARVVNIGSIDGIRVTHLKHYAYSASKAAVHQLTRVLAPDLAEHHVTVNAIAAGMFETKMTRGVIANAGGVDSLTSYIPLKRSGSPEDIVGLVLFFVSRAGAWTTGAIVPLDGGATVAAQL